MIDNKDLNNRLKECRLQYVGPGACYLPAYLYARHRYHKLLVKLGMLDKKLAERNPYDR